MMYMSNREIDEIKERAFRIYNKAREIVEANPTTYNKELVYSLMMEEQRILKQIKIK